MMGSDPFAALSGTEKQKGPATKPTLATGASDQDKAAYLSQLLFPDFLQSLAVIINIFIIILGWFSVGIEVYTRRDFGERYLTVFRVFCAAMVMSLAVGIGQTLGPFAGNGLPPELQQQFPFLGRVLATYNAALFQFIYWGFLLLSVFHLWRISRRNAKGEQWHSRSFGISHLDILIGVKIPALKIGRITLFGPVVITDWVLYCLIEPLFVALLGIGLRVTGAQAAAIFLFVGAASLFVKNLTVYAQQRARMLDLMDSNIESRYLLLALQGKPKQQAMGFSPVTLPTQLDRDGDGIPDDMQTPDFASTVAATMGQQPEPVAASADSA